MEYILAIGLLLFGLLFVLRLLLGEKIFNAAAGHWVYDISKAIIYLPFRIIKAIFKLIFGLLKK